MSAGKPSNDHAGGVNEMVARLRALTEPDITAALERAYIEFPITDAAMAVELVQCVLDHLTGERARVEAEDEGRVITPAPSA